MSFFRIVSRQKVEHNLTLVAHRVGKAAKASLRRRQTEESGESFWDAEELDGGSVSGRGTGIARQPFFPREAIMGALRTGKDSLWAL
jgi:hypothetical protein